MRAVAIVLLGALAFAGLGAPAVGASTRENGEKFTGVYRVHIKAEGQDAYGTIVMTFVGNETGTDPYGDQVRWSHKGRHFHFMAFPLDESYFATGDGIRNPKGFSSRHDPGVFKFVSTDDFKEHIGSWYAVKVRDPPES